MLGYPITLFVTSTMSCNVDLAVPTTATPRCSPSPSDDVSTPVDTLQSPSDHFPRSCRFGRRIQESKLRSMLSGEDENNSTGNDSHYNSNHRTGFCTRRCAKRALRGKRNSREYPRKLMRVRGTNVESDLSSNEIGGWSVSPGVRVAVVEQTCLPLLA